MEPLFIVLVPGLLGGLVLALLIASRGVGPHPPSYPRRFAAPSPALINMAHIPIEGVGGLGMVAAVLVVAVSDPRIRLATILAAVLGARPCAPPDRGQTTDRAAAVQGRRRHSPPFGRRVPCRSGQTRGDGLRLSIDGGGTKQLNLLAMSLYRLPVILALSATLAAVAEEPRLPGSGPRWRR